MSGSQLIEVLEQGFSLERGTIQVSGLVAIIDLEQPIGQRLPSLEVAGAPVDHNRVYRVATNSFLAEGGDLYLTFVGLQWVAHDERPISESVTRYFQDSPDRSLCLRAAAFFGSKASSKSTTDPSGMQVEGGWPCRWGCSETEGNRSARRSVYRLCGLRCPLLMLLTPVFVAPADQSFHSNSGSF